MRFPPHIQDRDLRDIPTYIKKQADLHHSNFLRLTWGFYIDNFFLEQLLDASMLDIILDVGDRTVKDSSQFCFPEAHILTGEQIIQHNYNTVEYTS